MRRLRLLAPPNQHRPNRRPNAGEASMTYYSVLAVTPTTDDWIPDYVAPANALVAKHGGNYLARTASHEQIEGTDTPAALRIILEWPSKEAAMGFMNDPDYGAPPEGPDGWVQQRPLSHRREGRPRLSDQGRMTAAPPIRLEFGVPIEHVIRHGVVNPLSTLPWQGWPWSTRSWESARSSGRGGGSDSPGSHGPDGHNRNAGLRICERMGKPIKAVDRHHQMAFGTARRGLRENLSGASEQHI